MNPLRILIAAVVVAALGYIVAFGSDYGAETAYAKKTTAAVTSTKHAGNSPVIKSIVVSSSVVAGNTTHLGNGQVKTTGATTTVCKPPANPGNNFTCR